MASDVTYLLRRFREGDEGARDELVPLVYAELRRIAQSHMRRQPRQHTLQPTALVNEAFVKLFEGERPQLVDRAHFLALMSRIMRQVLVDHARARSAAKRGGSSVRLALDSRVEIADDNAGPQPRLLDLDRALQVLERDHRSLAEVVEMYYFGGMTAEEAALAAGRSVNVVRRELRLARAWLHRELANSEMA